MHATIALYRTKIITRIMAKKQKRSKKRYDQNEEAPEGGRLGLSEQTLYAVLGVILLVVAIFFLLAAFEKAGLVGRVMYQNLSTFLGIGYYLLPILFFLLSSFVIRKIRHSPPF